MTHSAASQTVAQMAADGLVTLAPGHRRPATHRRPSPTGPGPCCPSLDAEWAATAAAARRFEAELAYPLSRLVDEALAALRQRSMRERIADVAPDLVPAGPTDGGPVTPPDDRRRHQGDRN